MYKKILVCLDGSNLAEQILPYAKEQAIQFSSKVFLLQVITTSNTIATFVPGVESVTVPYPSELEQFQSEEKEAKVYLNDMARPLRESGLDVECITVLGAQPGENIIRCAEENEVGLIAIATHGRSGLRRALLGSVAGYVVRKSGLPILVIKPQDKGK